MKLFLFIFLLVFIFLYLRNKLKNLFIITKNLRDSQLEREKNITDRAKIVKNED
jgi:hypothetical protein